MKIIISQIGILISLHASAFSFGDLTSHGAAIGCNNYNYETKVCNDNNVKQADTSDSSNSFDFGNFNLGTISNPLDGLNSNDSLFSTSTNKKVEKKEINTKISSNPFVSGELDKLCIDPVAEWDSTKGIVELATIGASFYIENMFSGGTSTADRQLAMKQKAIHINWMPMAVEKGIGQYIHTSRYKDKVLSAENARSGRDKKNIKKSKCYLG